MPKPKRVAAQNEAALKRAVVAALQLELRGRGKVLRLNAGKLVLSDAKYGRRVLSGVEPGTPDLLVLLPGGRCVWIELKAERGRVTELQASWHANARALGHHVAVCRTVQDAIATVLLVLEAA